MPGSRTNQLHLLLLILLLIPLQLLGKGVGFREISPKGGFTFGAIHNIIEDRHGFIWLGTRHGIFRYNSERIDKFNHIPFDNNSIPSNYITAITKDLNQQLWFASDNGIFFFDEAKETFEHCNFRDNYGQVLNANTR